MDPVTITALATSATIFLTPYLVKAGEAAAEAMGEKLPDVAGKVWNFIAAKLKGKPAAEEAAKDLRAKPQDEDNQAAFRKELKKALEADPAFADELKKLLEAAERETGQTILNLGSGAVGTGSATVASTGGVAVKGNVLGNVKVNAQKKT
jgi:hypothetical protein